METNCKNAKAEGGEAQECLARHRNLISWECQEQLFRQEVENAEDIRLSIRLFKACLADKKKARPCLCCSRPNMLASHLLSFHLRASRIWQSRAGKYVERPHMCYGI